MVNGKLNAPDWIDGRRSWRRLETGNGIADERLIFGLSLGEQTTASADLCLPCGDDAVDVVHSLDDLSHPRLDYVLVLERELRQAFNEAAETLMAELAESARTLIVLVGRRPAPNGYEEERVSSFICGASVFRDLIAFRGEISPERLCFAALYAILNGHVRADRILVRQIPYSAAETACLADEQDAAVILPHKGKLEHLDQALYFLDRMAGRRVFTRVGLDEENPCEYGTLADKYPRAEFYYAEPSRLGPYVIRQELARRSGESLLLFHDSDDVPCADRFAALAAEMRRSGCEFVGSYELQVDEVECEVVAARYPLDVSAALRDGNDGALLLGTSMIRREAFVRLGGFSTDQIIANDTQFLLRAYFALRIRNVGEFLYIRRIHHASLTAAPETGMGVPLRRELSQRWGADFEAVKSGRLRLEESSLRAMAGAARYAFLPFAPRVALTQAPRLAVEQEMVG